jgi:hypothetical protein
MGVIWRENAYDEVNVIARSSMLFSQGLQSQDENMAGREDGSGTGDPNDEPEPEIKPPLPEEIPAPQAPQPEIAPYQPPQPVDPGFPQPEA